MRHVNVKEYTKSKYKSVFLALAKKNSFSINKEAKKYGMNVGVLYQAKRNGCIIKTNVRGLHKWNQEFTPSEELAVKVTQDYYAYQQASGKPVKPVEVDLFSNLETFIMNQNKTNNDDVIPEDEVVEAVVDHEHAGIIDSIKKLSAVMFELVVSIDSIDTDKKMEMVNKLGSVRSNFKGIIN